MTSFELFEILNLIYFIYFIIILYLIFYLLKWIQYDKIQHLHIKALLRCFYFLRNRTT